MSIIERIKSLTPKQWAMIAGGGIVAGLGIDYYRRRDGSLVGRVLQKFHHHELPPPAHRQGAPRRPPMGAPPMGAPPSMDMGMPQQQFAMPSQVIVEEMIPGGWGHDWRAHGWPEHFGHGWPEEHHESHTPSFSHQGAPAHHR